MASKQFNVDLDLLGGARVIGMLDPVSAQDAVTKAYVDSAIEGIAWKDSVRVSTQSNLNLASPGATIDGITMALNDRLLVRSQTSAPENGIYIWNGAAAAATRSPDASTANELEQAVTTVEEGTNVGATFRQTTVNFTLDSGNVVWSAFGTSAPSASESTAGIIEIATQAEVDAGASALLAVTPAYLALYSGRARRYAVSFGDGSATSYVITHNLNTADVQVFIRETGGSQRQVEAEVRSTSVNAVTILVNTAPASNALRAVVIA